MAETLLPLAGYVAFFTLLHVLALARLEPVFPRAFKLSRAAAALVLTALGVAALVDAWPHWREAFLYRHAPGDWMRQGLLIVLGHLLADFLWMEVGRRRFGIRPRLDLILHHGLGVLGFGAALVLGIGHALALMTMITELLPVTTGVNALGKRAALSGLTRAADRARLHVLAWLRIPFWMLLMALVVHALLRGGTGELLPGYLVAACGLVMLVVLDSFWITRCLRSVDFY